MKIFKNEDLTNATSKNHFGSLEVFLEAVSRSAHTQVTLVCIYIYLQLMESLSFLEGRILVKSTRIRKLHLTRAHGILITHDIYKRPAIVQTNYQW